MTYTCRLQQRNVGFNVIRRRVCSIRFNHIAVYDIHNITVNFPSLYHFQCLAPSSIAELHDQVIALFSCLFFG